MPTQPIPKMPTPSPSVGEEIHRLLDSFARRIDELGLVNRDDHGNLVFQLPAVGARITELFNADRVTIRTDGSVNIAGCLEVAVRTVTATAAMQSTDSTLLCDATAGAFSVYLPQANLVTGRTYAVKKIDASGNAVTLDANAGELIDGATTNAIAAQWNGRIIQSNGLAWYVLANI